MSIIKHFLEGNNDQQYENLHSHWKEDDKEMTNQSMSEPIITTYNTAYNQAIQDAIEIMQKQFDIEPDYSTQKAIVGNLIQEVGKLLKPS